MFIEHITREEAIELLDSMTQKQNHYPPGYSKFSHSIETVKKFLDYEVGITMEDCFFELVKAYQISKNFLDEQGIDKYMNRVRKVVFYFYHWLKLSIIAGRDELVYNDNVLTAILLQAKTRFVREGYKSKYYAHINK